MVASDKQETNVEEKSLSAASAIAAADPSAARKRRKAIIESQRKESEEAAQQKDSENEGSKTNAAGKSSAQGSTVASEEGPESEGEEDSHNNGNSAKKRKTKRTQIRYDPDVPMSKEQLAAWRREARRVRNRESAAASRQRIRNRITELETEVDEYKSKYHAALERLKELEELTKANRGATGDAVGLANEQGASSESMV